MYVRHLDLIFAALFHSHEKSVLFSVYAIAAEEALVETNKRVVSLTRETDDAGPAPKRANKTTPHTL